MNSLSVLAPNSPPPALSGESDEGPPRNLSELLSRAVQRYPRTGICLVSAEHEGRAESVTYAALLDEARRILGGLRPRAAPGAKVVLLLESAGDFIPAFWACVLGGYVPCPMAPVRNDPERWTRQLAHVDDLFEQPLFVATGTLASELTGVSAVELDTLRAAAPAEAAHHARTEDPAVLVLTSGSTGNSKAVVLSHGNLLAAMEAKRERYELTGADTTLNWISFDHVAALLEMHLLPLSVGALQVHVDAASILSDPLLFLRLIDRHRVSVTFAPNFLFGQLNAALRVGETGEEQPVVRPGLDLSCIRHIVSGGEAVVVDTGLRLLASLAPNGLPRTGLWPAFGMTETCAGIVFSQEFPDRDAGREFASLGTAVTGLSMRIVDEAGAVLPDGEVGELQLRGPMVFTGYHNNPEATEAAFTADGWFRTGDLGYLDDQHLNLVGRNKDSIIVSGVNYFGHELETVLEQLDGVDRSFVAAFPTRPPGSDTEQLVVAFATSLADDDEARLHQLMTAVRNTTIMLWGFRPAVVLPLPRAAFPKTSLGKIQRSLLRRRLEAGDFADRQAWVATLTGRQLGGYTAPEGELETRIVRIFAELFGLDAAEVSATASFFDLGGTSLDVIRLKRALEPLLGVADLPVVRIMQHPTARALAAPDTGGYDPVVPLQLTGDKTPLFCIHPGVGDVLVYVNLANYFVGERPFYALRARGFNEGEAYFSSMDELVETYVAAIRARQPHGPYAIAGYSFSGPVAFEIAKVLEAAGEEVAFLASIDMRPYIVEPGNDFLDEIETAVMVAFFLSLIDREQMDALPGQLRDPHLDPYARILEVAPVARVAELGLDTDRFRAWSELAHSLVVLARKYVPDGEVEALTVFHAEPLWGTRAEWEAEIRGWDRYTRQPTRYLEVAGEHHTLMGPRHVAGFQEALRAELDRALGGR